LLDLLGAGLHLAFKLHRGLEEIEEGNRRAVHGGEAVPEAFPLHAVIADVLPDDRAVFLFDSDRRSASNGRFSCGLLSG
jgi:hypothetical protein